MRRNWGAERFSPWLLERRPIRLEGLALCLCTLGQVSVLLEGQSVHITLSKSLELLLFLALEGPATRAELVRALWDGSSETKHIEYFRVAVRRLRSDLSQHPEIYFDPMPFEHGVYRLHPQLRVQWDSPMWQNTQDFPLELEHLNSLLLPGLESRWAQDARERAQTQLQRRALEHAQTLKGSDPTEAQRWYDYLAGQN